jgi:hypothetical protein
MHDKIAIPRRSEKEAHNRLSVLTRFLFGILTFLVSSCAGTESKQYNLAFDGPPRPAEEATLSIFCGYSGVYPVKIDGRGTDKSGSRFNSVRHTMTSAGGGYTKVVRLLPGPHQVTVYYIDPQINYDVRSKAPQTVSFNAVAGKNYSLKSGVSGMTWQAAVIEQGNNTTQALNTH